MLTEIFILCLLAYLCGSVPFGVLLAKTQNMDIREHGSGNIGATNVARTMGKKAGLITLAGDVLKGLLVVFIASQWFDSTMVTAMAGLAVFLGHLYSIFLKFKGGKGVATGLGILSFAMPLSTPVFCRGFRYIPENFRICVLELDSGGNLPASIGNLLQNAASLYLPGHHRGIIYPAKASRQHRSADSRDGSIFF